MALWGDAPNISDMFVTFLQLLIESIGVIVGQACREEGRELLESFRHFYEELKVEEVRVYELGLRCSSPLEGADFETLIKLRKLYVKYKINVI